MREGVEGGHDGDAYVCVNVWMDGWMDGYVCMYVWKDRRMKEA